jgi:hypothetical protein
MNLSPDDKKPQKLPPLSPTPPQNPNPISCQFTQASYLSVTQSGALQFTQAPMLLVTVHLLSSPQASFIVDLFVLTQGLPFAAYLVPLAVASHGLPHH